MNSTIVAVFLLAALYATYRAFTEWEGTTALFGAILWAILWGASRRIVSSETGATTESPELATLAFFGVLVLGIVALADLLGEAKDAL